MLGIKKLILKLIGIVLLALAAWMVCDIYQALRLPESSSDPIELVIPLAAKDLEVFPLMLASVRKNLRQPISKIVVIAADQKPIRELCARLDVQFIDENTILKREPFLKIVANYGVSKIYKVRPDSWYYQQLLKLYYAQYTNAVDYLVVDADLIWLRPMVFKTAANKYRFHRMQNLAQDAYICASNQLLGLDIREHNSYVADMMLFNRRVVLAMLTEIEKRAGQDFAAAILKVSSSNTDCRFSEYETYGRYFANFVFDIQSERVAIYKYYPSSFPPRPNGLFTHMFHYMAYVNM